MKLRLGNSATENARPLLWLGLGVFFLVFANGKWIVPAAAWLAPVFLVRFFRGGGWRRLALGYLAITLVFAVTWRGMIPLPDSLFYSVSPAFALLLFLPYLTDRLLAPRLPHFGATLVYPTAVVSLEYTNALLSPYGTWGATAYTQFGNLPLVQLAGLTGLWGISFFVSWLGPIVNWAWERGFAWPEIRRNLLPAISLLCAAHLYGGLRVGLFPPDSPTIRVASITGTLGSAESARTRASQREAMMAKRDELFELSQREANAGAKVIFWSEADCLTFKQDESELIERAMRFSRENAVYLMMGVGTVTPGQRLIENKIVTIEPDGTLLAEYLKSFPVPGEPSLPGDGKLVTIDTGKVRIAQAICFDMDFPQLVRQAGKSGADIIVAPSLDWAEIDPLHTHMATFRAIENGASVIRQANHGLSLAVDHNGKVLARADFYQGSPQVMVTHAPTEGVTTAYPRIGDVLAWACLLLLPILVVVAVRSGPAC